ncbi:branched-chain amino acid ABC transporter permease [Acrocarpospora catenulata]|uniref:branched-chain amino acid ABC transporter permease n=1 Tax=Acrocarpospora catenulata TaxID=2836182 RepID=UPI001BDAAE46|nr:branched-chain amino acid ABC transporter permease [Acrocarpospora catenulata]
MSGISAILTSALVLGGLYLLMAAGLTLIWSTLRVFNFGHGALLMFGAYLSWTLLDRAGLPLLPALVGGVLALALLGVVYEFLLVSPFIRRPNGDMLVMVATLAATMLLQSGALLLWGPEIKQLPPLGSARIELGGSVVQGTQLVTIILAPVLVGLLALALKRTGIGLTVRALEQNREHAQLLGISPRRVYLFVVTVAIALAAVAGVLLGSMRFISPTMGDDPLLRAFVVLAFGGAGSLGGTIAGAYAIGLLEAVTTYYFGLSWSPVLVFLAMIVIMLARPEGLLRSQVRSA